MSMHVSSSWERDRSSVALPLFPCWKAFFGGGMFSSAAGRTVKEIVKPPEANL